jgi:hypothetical protein
MTVEVKTPQTSNTEATAAAITTLSSEIDPAPHYIVGSACFGAAGYSYFFLRNPTASLIAAGIGGAYWYAG